MLGTQILELLVLLAQELRAPLQGSWELWPPSQMVLGQWTQELLREEGLGDKEIWADRERVRGVHGGQIVLSELYRMQTPNEYSETGNSKINK